MDKLETNDMVRVSQSYPDSDAAGMIGFVLKSKEIEGGYIYRVETGPGQQFWILDEDLRRVEDKISRLEVAISSEWQRGYDDAMGELEEADRTGSEEVENRYRPTPGSYEQYDAGWAAACDKWDRDHGAYNTEAGRKEAKVVHKDDGWYVESEEGKNLGGPYGSEEKAKERLQQVEYFKHQSFLQYKLEVEAEKEKTGLRTGPYYKDLNEYSDQYEDGYSAAIEFLEDRGNLIENGDSGVVVQGLWQQYILQFPAFMDFPGYQAGFIRGLKDCLSAEVKGSKIAVRYGIWADGELLGTFDTVKEAEDAKSDVQGEFPGSDVQVGAVTGENEYFNNLSFPEDDEGEYINYSDIDFSKFKQSKIGARKEAVEIPAIGDKVYYIDAFQDPEEQYGIVFNSSPDLVTVIRDSDGKYVSVPTYSIKKAAGIKEAYVVFEVGDEVVSVVEFTDDFGETLLYGTFGTVTKLEQINNKDHVEVEWVDGTRSYVYPSDIAPASEAESEGFWATSKKRSAMNMKDEGWGLGYSWAGTVDTSGLLIEQVPDFVTNNAHVEEIGPAREGQEDENFFNGFVEGVIDFMASSENEAIARASNFPNQLIRDLLREKPEDRKQ